eukprot:COSAG01_NODE_12692_length_1699_cov_1.116875_1_plen_36_part_00
MAACACADLRAAPIQAMIGGKYAAASSSWLELKTP